MWLRKIVEGDCGSKNCPSVYETDQESFIFQGARVRDPDALSQIGLSAEEGAVEVPREVIEELVEKLRP